MNEFAKGCRRPDLIVLVRHGRSQYNEAKAGNPYFLDEKAIDPVRGIPDQSISLTEVGRKQAQDTGVELAKDYPTFDALYHSNYLRTVETAEIILRTYPQSIQDGIRIRGDDRLRERQAGYGFHMTKEAFDTHFPYYEDHYNTTGYFYTIPPGGESQAHVCERVYHSIGRWFEHRAGESILVVAHEGTLRAVRYNLERWSAKDYERSLAMPGHNCGVWAYKFSHETQRLELVVENKKYY